MSLFDWFLIVLYGFGMVAIGWYSGRDTESTDDFLVGGRKMNPILVGLSLFATLMSSLSYLAVPGDISGFGPFLYAQICAYPFIILIVGWGLIPYIMKQPVTSAYELLEKRLGSRARTCAAIMFLLLRMGWMAAILYALCDKILMPLLGLKEGIPIPMLKITLDAVPWLCLITGLITVFYAAHGGIKAVVLTDVAQSIIMIAGAFATIMVITWRLGGVDAWFPTVWKEHWPHYNLFSWSDRSFIGAAFASLSWYICTAGADQMAIQRYLSTRNISTARRTLITSMCTDVLVTTLLVLVGLAVLGYFQHQDPNLPVGEALAKSADELFPRFITHEMPSGVRGLVMVAILAAAMSSLSSGINSCCAVIKEDILNRIPSFQRYMTNPVRTVRVLSFVIGMFAVALSLVLPLLQANLLELCYKVVNLLTAPIFILFFMAMFVPFATRIGAFLGLTASIVTAVLIVYYDHVLKLLKHIGPESWAVELNFKVSFYWMTPGALVVGIVVGVVASLLTQPRPAAETS